jgi:hypothetical protein
MDTVGFLAGEHFHPMDLALATVGLLHGCIHDAHAGAPDVRTRSVAFDERNDGVFGDDEFAVPDRDPGALRRGRDL